MCWLGNVNGCCGRWYSCGTCATPLDVVQVGWPFPFYATSPGQTPGDLQDPTSRTPPPD